MRIVAIVIAMLLACTALVYADTCAVGSIACMTANGTGRCGTDPMCVGTCVGGSNQGSCTYIRCNSTTPACVGIPFGPLGCTADGQCGANAVCISDSGTAGCGTGFSQCVSVCSETTTTTSTSVTTSVSTTSTSTSSTTSTTINDIIVHFQTTDDWVGKIHIITTSETFDLPGGGPGSLVDLVTHTFSDGTLVEVEALTTLSAPFCNDPGQGWTFIWSVFTPDYCLVNRWYRVHVTLNAGEATEGSILFVPHG